MARFKATWLVPQKDSVARWHIARRWRTDAFTKTCWQEICWFLIHDRMILNWYDFYDSIIWILWFWFRLQRNPLDFPPIQMPLYRFWYWYRPFLPVCVDTSPKSTAVPCPVRLVLQQISPGTKTDQSHEGTLAEWWLESHYLGKFHKLSKINMVYIAIQHRFEKKKRTKRARFVLYLPWVQCLSWHIYCAKCPNPMEFDDVLMPLGALNWAKPLPRSAR